MTIANDRRVVSKDVVNLHIELSELALQYLPYSHCIREMKNTAVISLSDNKLCFL